MIGKVLNLVGEVAVGGNHTFRQICFDILLPEVPGHEREMVKRLIDDMNAEPLLTGGKHG
jgi:hypothetical protein